MPKISVLVPVCNVEKYIGKCLDSILGQTFKDMEIICMDDGSTDLSGRILDEYALTDSRIKVVHKPNSGYGHTMNQALEMARGEYIGIVESDDYIDANMYEVLYQAAIEHNLDLVKSDYYQMWQREDGSAYCIYRPLTEKDELYHVVLKPNNKQESYFLEKFTWNALYKREYLTKNGVRYNETPGASYQDNGFWFQTFYHAERVMFLKQAFYRYKQDNPTSSINSDQKVYAMKNEYDFIRDFLLEQKEQNPNFYRIAFHFRLLGYFFTLNQIADTYKTEFANVIVKECRFYEKLGEAVYDWMTEKQIEILKRLNEDLDGYVKELQYKETDIPQEYRDISQIIIYGAGNYGRGAYWKIKKIVGNARKVNFAVTNLNGEKEYYQKEVIYEITDFVKQKDSALVILAVKKESDAYMAMSQKLHELGFQNIKDSMEI
uniref:glycosyltransferase family 2 protein n=1 Tax=Acetatifactor sp. TaxID=1872090 RepID=UPI004055DFB9